MTTQELRYRSAEQIGVNYPDRTIELIVMPYERETMVAHQGRMVTEVCSRGAFNGIERRANRVRVNRDHDVKRTCGRAVAFYPDRPEGLVARVRIAQTELGDETLTLADEDMLDASAGFLPMPGGEKWEHRSRCRLTKCWLGHIAMTPDPAYETARVLAVRQRDEQRADEPAATPNLDLLRQWDLQDRYPELRT